MGFFSWNTADTNEQIMNQHTPKPTVVTVVWPNNEKWINVTNDGYGRFGMMDIQKAIMEKNNINEDDAIDALCDLKEAHIKGLIVPKFFKDKNLNYDDVPTHSSRAKGQGYWEA